MKAEEIKKRFREEYEKPRSMVIEQLGIEIYFYPVTIEFEQHLKAKFKDLGSEEDRVLETIFQNALDSNGEKIWTTDEDREFLRKRVPSSVLARIINAMSGISFDKAKKNSRKIQN